MTARVFPDGFETSRLQAERLEPHHVDEIRRMHRDAAVMAHLGGLRDDAQTASYLAKNLKHWSDYNFGLWIVRERSGGEPIGRALLRTYLHDGQRDIEVGYAFYEPFWKRGLATEVTTRCLGLAREHLHATTIVAITSPENVASQHVLQKCGLAFERTFIHEGAPAVLYRIRWTGANGT